MNISFQISTPVIAEHLGLDHDAMAGWIGSNYDDFVSACVNGGMSALMAAGLPAAPPIEATEESEVAPASTSDAVNITDPAAPSDSPPVS